MANWARRSERKSEHRQRLIRAATEVFADKGYFGASVEEIAARAGLTKGAVYSSFAGKEELLLAVTRSLSVSLDPPDSTAPLGHQARELGRAVAELVASKEVHAVAPRELELGILSLTSEFVRTELLAASARQIETTAGYVSQEAEKQGVALPLPPSEVATLLMAVRMGLVQLHLHDPEAVPVRYFEDAFELIITGATTPAAK